MDYDVAIIGGGVVGCAILHELSSQGLSCVLCEQSEDILSGASSGNSGTLHTGFDAPLNTLELTCIERARELNEEFFKDYNIPHRVSGAYIVAWSEDDLAKLPGIVANSHACGVLDVRQISKEELAEIEPHLSSDALGAVFVPKEMIVDPWFFPSTVAHLALQRGGKIETACKVEGGKAMKGGWELQTSSRKVTAKFAINCAGLFGDFVESINRKSPFTIKPRKGQYAVFSQTAKSLLSSIIFPVPTERTKGVLLFPSIYGNIVVGPTAEEQSDRNNAEIDQEVIKKLIDQAHLMLPGLKKHQVIGTYAGLRPATEHKDYQIEAMLDKNWITVGGIRSTGLSACFGIAKYVSAMLKTHEQFQDMKQCGLANKKLKDRVYMEEDGSVSFAGKTWKITHPLTRFGVATADGAAKFKSHLKIDD